MSDLLTNKLKSIQREPAPGERLAKVAGLHQKYTNLVGNRNGNEVMPASPDPSPSPGLIITGWKALSPVKKGIVVALFHMEHCSRWDRMDFANLADSGELYLQQGYEMDNDLGVTEVLEGALKKAGISYKKIERRGA